MRFFYTRPSFLVVFVCALDDQRAIAPCRRLGIHLTCLEMTVWGARIFACGRLCHPESPQHITDREARRFYFRFVFYNLA
uniref:Putative secreted protein n=1 Tax=Anopheles marajoara TaxID=58244 RepID=A0A2M4CBR8_9DIPT